MSRERGETSAAEWRRWWRERGERELALILWAAWNPIASGVPTDEFEDYAGRLGGLLADGADRTRVARELAEIRREWMHDARRWDADEVTADLLVDWYEETWLP